MMPEQVERNKAILRRYVDEAWNKRNPGAAKDVLAPNFVYNQITTNKKLAGYAGLEQAFRAFATLMPDYQFDIKAIFGEGDMVAAYPAFNTAATLVVEAHEQGAVAGLTGTATGVGFMAGPLFGTLLHQWRIDSAFGAAGLLMALITVLVWRHPVFERLAHGARPEMPAARVAS